MVEQLVVEQLIEEQLVVEQLVEEEVVERIHQEDFGCSFRSSSFCKR